LRHSDFVHLHVHSDYSLLDGAGSIPAYIKRATELNMPALALTDHGSMFGAVFFYKMAIKSGIKPLVGCELYVTRGSRFDKKAPKRGAWEQVNHIIVLARDMEGYLNLMKLSSLGYTEGFYYRPRIDLDLLAEHSAGLVGLGACIKGIVSEEIINDRPAEARAQAGRLRDIFGDDNFYFEIQNHGLPEEAKAMKGLLQLSTEMGIPVVATNDCHYIHQDDAKAQDVLLCIQTGRDLDDPNRLRFANDQFYLKTPEEMKDLFHEHPETISNTLEVAEKCNLELDLGVVQLPNFPIPDGFSDADAYLESLVRKGLTRRYPGNPPEALERLQYELKVIEQMKYSSYFLIVKDLVDKARDMGIAVGPGRGSAAGSIVSYCLGITDIDPLKFGLLFERFLNPERISMPDIDIDFCDRRRDEIIEYVARKYGRESVSQIITFGTLGARAAIRDVGRVLKVPLSDVDRIAKLVPPEVGITLEAAIERVAELREAAESPEYIELITLSRKLEGLARHASTHAAGVLIAPGKLIDYVPLYRGNKGEVVTQYDMKSVEDIGLLKMDFLGLTTLSIVEDALDMIKERHGVEIVPAEIPVDDEEVYALLSRGDTIGVFQLESSGMRDLLRRISPERFEDIVAINALYRPGPLSSEMVDLFIKRKRGQKEIVYDHPMLEPILKDTYGVILYQEQVIEIANKMAGFTKGQGDILRKAMGKKEIQVMDQQRRNFVSGCVANRIKEDLAEHIFSQIAYFAGYGFNKSHSAAYAMLSYQTAYLKAKYPAEFMAACLTSEIGNTDRVVTLLEETRRMGIKVLPPDVNESYHDFRVTDEGIRFGLQAVKNVGRAAIDAIVRAREKHGPPGSIFEVCERVSPGSLNKRVLESLIMAGALDSLKGHRAQLMAAVETAMSVGAKSQRDRSAGQTSLLAVLVDHGEENGIERSLPPVPEWSDIAKLNHEKEVLGFYCSGHPLSRFENEIRWFATATLDRAREMRDGDRVIVAGIISDRKIHLGKRGQRIGFITLEDLTGVMEAIVFDDRMRSDGERLVPGSMLLVSGTISIRREDAPKIRVNDLIDLEGCIDRMAGGMELSIDLADFTDDGLDILTGILDSSPGEVPVSIVVCGGEAGDIEIDIPEVHVKPSRDLVSATLNVVGVKDVRILPKSSNHRVLT
jgi:DNA polymerase-3 subunit alpha